MSVFLILLTQAIILIVNDDDEETSSRQTRRPPKNRKRLAGHEMLVRDYFADDPMYGDQLFARRFRIYATISDEQTTIQTDS